MATVTKQQKFENTSAKGLLLHLATIAMGQSDFYLSNSYLANVAKQVTRQLHCYASGHLSLWKHALPIETYNAILANRD